MNGPSQRARMRPAPAASRPDRGPRRVNRGPIDVSVCIVNWNCRELLRQCLASLYHQPQGVHFETIVVDNGSTDGAADMVEGEFPEVVVFRNPTNLGFSRANNHAAGRARGHYLLFLNNDTVLSRGALRRLLDYALAHPEVGMIGPQLRDGHGQVQASYRCRPTVTTFLHRTTLVRITHLLRGKYQRSRCRTFDFQSTRRVDVLMGAALFMRQEVFVACGGWDEDYTFGGEDLDLSYRVGRNYPLVYYPEVEITHYGRSSTRRNVAFAVPHIMIGFVRYLRKTGCSRLALWVYKLLVTLDAPVQLVEKSTQSLLRRVRGRRSASEKSLLIARGLYYFLRHGLVEFWKT